MPLDTTKPFKIVYIDIGPVVEQDGKRYTLDGIEIVQETNGEPTTDKTTSTTTSGKKQPRSRKQP